jgi:hypothetical protein
MCGRIIKEFGPASRPEKKKRSVRKQNPKEEKKKNTKAGLCPRHDRVRDPRAA